MQINAFVAAISRSCDIGSSKGKAEQLNRTGCQLITTSTLLHMLSALLQDSGLIGKWHQTNQDVATSFETGTALVTEDAVDAASEEGVAPGALLDDPHSPATSLGAWT